MKHIPKASSLELDWVVEEVVKKEIHSRKKTNRVRGQYAAAMKKIQDMERKRQRSIEEWEKAQQHKLLRTRLETTEAELKQFKDREAANAD